MSPCGGRKMPSCGKTKNAYALRVESPFLCSRTDQSDGTRRVLKRSRMMIARANSVLKNESCDAERVEPFGYGRSFVVRKMRIASARTDYDRRAGCFLLRRKIWSQSWDVCGFVSGCARRAFGPENDRTLRRGFHYRREQRQADS